MKKLGLCACYNNKNYGSQLQSYALKLCLDRDFRSKKIQPFAKISETIVGFAPTQLFSRVLKSEITALSAQVVLFTVTSPQILL